MSGTRILFEQSPWKYVDIESLSAKSLISYRKSIIRFLAYIESSKCTLSSSMVIMVKKLNLLLEDKDSPFWKVRDLTKKKKQALRRR